MPEKPLHVEFKFTDDSHTAVRFELPSKLEADADGLTRMIALFSGVRAAMKPEVSERPGPIDKYTHIVDDADFEVGIGTHGVALALRHPGVGWIRCQLLPEHARRLIGNLQTVVTRVVEPPRH